MQPRMMIVTALASGPVLGMLLGLAAHPVMTAPPEPSWRKAQPDAIFTRSQPLVDAGPQDLDPRWDVDHTPTWKRDAAARMVAARTAMEDAAYRLDYASDLTAPAEIAEPAAAPAADSVEAAAERNPAHDAATAVQPAAAAVEPEAPAAEAGG